MKVYQLSKQTVDAYYSSTNTSIGFYLDKFKAITEAKKLQKKVNYKIVFSYPDKINNDGYGHLYTDLNGNETDIPYDAYIITEIEVK